MIKKNMALDAHLYIYFVKIQQDMETIPLNEKHYICDF